MPHLKLLRRSCIAIAVLLTSTGCLVSEPAPNLLGQDVHLTIVHTADIHSRIFPYTFTPNRFELSYGLNPPQGPFGGAAREWTLIQEERERSARFLHLDSGDWFQGAPIFNVFAGEAELRAMTEMHTDAAAVGNHEFDKGSDNLAAQLSLWGGFPALASDYIFEDYTQQGQNSLGQVIRPYTILNVDGLVVGVIGLGNIDTLTDIVEGGNSLGLTPMDPVQTVRTYAQLLRPQVDLLVVVSHLGLDGDTQIATTPASTDPTKEPSDVDIIFGGHIHVVLNPPETIPEYDTSGKPTGHNTIISHSGAFAKTFGRMDLIVHVNSPAEIAQMVKDGQAPRRGYVKAFDYQVVPVVAKEAVDGDLCVTPDEDQSGQSCTATKPGYGYCQTTTEAGQRKKCMVGGGDCGQGDPCLPCIYCHVPEDADMSRILEPYELKLNQSLDLTRVFAGVAVAKSAGVPGVIARKAQNGGDSQLGNLVAASMRFEKNVQADFALTNTLGIRADFDNGPLSLEEMYNVFPFENTIEVMYLSGDEVQQMLDYVAERSGERGCQSQAQVSGISFVMDCSRRKADLVLVGSGNNCTSDAQCAATSEVCGATLGFCQSSTNPAGSSMSICQVNGASTCQSGETCQPSELDKCGKLLNPNATYKVAVNDYIAGGGSGFLMLKRNTAKYDTGISLRDALVNYLQDLDDPQYEGPFSCDAGATPSASTCHGAIRCDDPRWQSNPYLQANDLITPDIAAAACPGKTGVGSCYGDIVCILPHNQQADGRILPRME